MLQSIRDRVQGWFAWIFIVLLGIVFALWGIDRFIANLNAPSQVVAKINGQDISTNQFTITYERLKRQLQLELGENFTLNQQTETQLKQQALKLLINNTLLTQAAIKDGFRITSNQIDTVLATAPAFQDNGHFSVEKFQKILNALMFSESAFIEQLRTGMLINQVQVGFTSSAFALPNDINTAYRLLNQTREGGYLVVPYHGFLKQLNVSEQEQQAYYDQHKNSFKTPEQVSLAYLTLSLPTIQSKIQPTEAELKQYYQENIDNYTMPSHWEVAHILVNIPDNATAEQLTQAQSKLSMIAKQLNPDNGNFGQLAQKYSDDVVSAKGGGILPWFTSGTAGFGTAFESAVQNLKPGQVSAPVRTQYGLELIKLLAVKPKQIQPYEQVHDQIKNVLAQQKAQQIYANQSQQLADLTYSNASTLTAASTTLGLPIQTTALFDRKGSKTDKSNITNNPKILAAAFSPSVLNQANNSDVIQLDQNTQIVIRVQEHNLAKIKPFITVKDEIKNILLTAKAKQAAEALGKSMLEKLHQGANPAQLAKENNLVWQKFTKLGRHSNGVDANILNQIFLLPRPGAATSTPTDGLSLPTGDYAVITVNNVTDGDSKNMTDAERQAFQQQLATNFGRLDFQLYTAEHKQNAKIKIEQSSVAAAQVDNSN